MAVNVPLSTLRRNLRAEIGSSLNPQQGVAAQASLDLMLDRQQRELWDAYTWRHLRIFRDIALAKGQAIYSYPADLPFEQVLKVWFAASNTAARWQTLLYGISPSMIPPSGPRSGTPYWWDNVTSSAVPTSPIGQMTIMPTPSADGMLMRLEGQAAIGPLVADTDKCMLDSDLITLFAAAEILATQKAEVAPMKLTKAQNHLRRLQQNQGGDKRVNRNMGGSQRFGNDPDKSRYMVPYLDYMPM
jgi:hypothetical protein